MTAAIPATSAPPAFAFMPRTALEATVEALIAELDRRDGDTDREDEPAEAGEVIPEDVEACAVPPLVNDPAVIPHPLLERVDAALEPFRRPVGPMRTREFLAVSAVVLAVEEAAGLPGDPAHRHRVAALGGIPRRLAL